MSLENGAGGSKENTEEAIASPALLYDGKIFRGRNHGMALLELESKCPDFESKKVTDGFVTTSGRFVDREEADAIAIKAGQAKGGRQRGYLDSNDMLSYKK